MFRATDPFQWSTLQSSPLQSGPLQPDARQALPIVVTDEKSRRAEFEPDDEIGTLMPVYSEIARRLPRNAYTRHGTA